MQRACAVATAGQGDVDRFRSQAAFQFGVRDRAGARLELSRQLFLDLVDLLAESLALLVWHAAEAFQKIGDPALLAEQIDSQRFDRARLCSSSDIALRLLQQLVEIGCGNRVHGTDHSMDA